MYKMSKINTKPPDGGDLFPYKHDHPRVGRHCLCCQKIMNRNHFHLPGLQDQAQVQLGSVTPDTFLCFDTELLYVTQINTFVSLTNLRNIVLLPQLLIVYGTKAAIEDHLLKMR